MLCENCNGPHNGSFGKGRFCCRACSAAFSTKLKRLEINEKLSIKAKDRISKYKDNPKLFDSPIIFTKETHQKTVSSNKSRILNKTLTENWDSIGIRLKRSRILIEQNNSCNRCNLTSWLGEKITLELEHKDGDRLNNSRENLELLCPNCHSLTSTWRGRKKRVSTKKVNDQDIINALEKHKSISKALSSLGLNPSGNNFKRVQRLKKS